MPTDILRKRSDRVLPGPNAKVQPTSAERILLIAAGPAQLRARLAETATAERIWAALPLYGAIEPWGETINFEVPVASGRDRTARLQAAWAISAIGVTSVAFSLLTVPRRSHALAKYACPHPPTCLPSPSTTSGS